MKKLLHFKSCLLVGLFFVLLAVAGEANGATRIASVSGFWDDPATWGGMAAPTNSDDIIINAGITVTMNVNGTCSTITDMADGSIDGTWTLTIAGNAGNAISDITGTATISCPLLMPADASVTVTGNLTISNQISGAATGLTKYGSGKLILTSSNTFAGATIISAGIINIQNSSALGDATGGGVTVLPGGRLELEGSLLTITKTLSLSGQGDGTAEGALYNVSGNNFWVGPISVDNTVTSINSVGGGLIIVGTIDLKGNKMIIQVGGSSLTFIQGTISSSSGVGSLTKEGPGELSFGSQPVILNTLTINDGTLTSTTGNINLAGNYVNNGIFNHAGGTIILNGSSVQSFGGTQVSTFNNLTLANASGAILGNSEIIGGTLTLTNGNLVLGSNNLTLGLAAVAGTPSVSNMIVADGAGECRRIFTSSGSYVFPIGDETGAAEYSPITLDFTSGTFSSAYAAVRVADDKHPDNTSPVDFLTRYWTVTQTGISSYTCDVTASFPLADVNGNISNMTTGLWNGTGPWQNVGLVTATTISATGVTSFGDFTGISLPPSSFSVTISADPASTICKDASLTLTANAVGGPVSSYLWSPGGETTQTISPSTAVPGSTLYTVMVTDANGITATDNLTVTVNPDLVVTASPGLQTICSGTATSVALTSNVSGTTYTWIVVQSGVSGASDGSGDFIAETLTATGITAGTATYTITPKANGCDGAPISVIVTVNPLPVVTATPDSQTICSGTATPIALASNVDLTVFGWTVFESGVSGAAAGSGNSISQVLAATGTSAGTATYTITPTANNCEGATKTVVITVNPIPVASATPALQTICSGTAPSVALISNVAGTIFDWTITQSGVSGASAGSGTTIAQTLTLTGATSGTVTYSITPTANNCIGTPIIVVITVTPSPFATATPSSQTICSGTAPTIALSGSMSGTAFAWTVAQTGVSGASAGSGTSISQMLTATGAIDGTATYMITPTADGCAGTPIAVVITVHPNPGVIATPFSQTICSGTAPSVILTSDVTGSMFDWTVVQSGISGASAGSGSSIAQILTALGTNAGSATYTITPTANVCAGTPLNVVITVNPIPVITVTPSSQPICSGTAPSIALTSNVSGSTFAWTVVQSGVSGASAGSGTSVAQILTVTGTASGTATYTITPTANSCAGTLKTVAITVSPTPVVTATPLSQTNCSGTATSIDLTSTVTGTTFAWTVVQSGVSGASAGSGTTISQSLTTTGSASGTATYTITPTVNTCTGVPVIVVITVNPNLILTVTPSSQTICSGTVTSVLLTSNVTGATFDWTMVQSGVSGASDGSGTTIAQVLTATGATAGLATYSITSAANGCASVSKTIVITVNPTPIVTATPFSQTICSATAPYIGLTSNVAGTAYAWTVVQSGVSGASAGSGPTIAQVLSATGTTAGTATYTITPVASNCAGTPVSVDITVNPIPVVTASASAQTICSGTAPSIALSSNAASTTFSWVVIQSGVSGASAGSGTAITQTLSATGTTAGTATYVITPNANSCSGTPKTVIITVNPIPIVTATPSIQTVCSGIVPAIALSSNVAGTTFSWTVVQSGVTGALAGSGSAIAQALTTSGIIAGTATYTIIPTANGCAGAPITVIITVNPSPAITAIPTSQTICSATAPSVILSSNISGSTYSWTVVQSGVSGASAGSGSSVTQTLSATGTAAGTATYTITPTANSCAGIPLAVVITVDPIPIVTVTPLMQTICSGTATSIALTSNVSGTTYTWTVVQSGVSGATTGSGTPVSQPLTATAATAGTATYTITPTANGCAGTPKTVVITVNPIPVATATPSLQSICSGTTSTIALTSNVSGSTFAWTVVQSGVSGASAGSGTTIAQLLSATGTNAGTATYTITPTANGCSGASVNVVITVNPTPVITAAPSSQTNCSGTATSIVLTSNVAGTTFAWTVVPSGVSGASAGSGTTISQILTATGTASGTATYSITPTANGCDGTIVNVVITVHPIPVALATPSSQNICSGSSTSIALSSNVTGTTFATTVIVSPAGSITGSSNGSGNSISQTLMNSTALQATATYTITPTANGCPGNPITVVVTVNPIPALSSPLTASVCESNLFTYIPTSNIPSASFAWTRAAVLGIQNVAASGTGTVNEILVNTTAFTRTVTYIFTTTANGCSKTQSVAVTVYPRPTLLSLLSPPAVCSDAPFSYTATSTVAGTTFTWVRAVVAGISNAAGAGTGNINETLINTTNNNIIVPYVYTLTAGSCTSTVIVNATVRPRLVLSSSLTPADICSNSVFIYNPTCPFPGTFISWSRFPVAGITNGPGFGSNSPDETLINVTANPVNVTYVYTIQANGCAYSQNVVVVVNPNPTVDDLPDKEFCSGTSTSVIPFTGPANATSFSWTNNNTSIGLAANGSGDLPSFIATNNTSLPVFASITVTPTAKGCAGTPFTFIITVNPTATADIPANQDICNGAPSGTIIFTGILAGISWTNNHPEIGLVAAGTGNIGSFTGSNPGLNPIVATITAIPHYSISGPGCDGTPITFTITVNPTPAVNAVSNEVLCAGDNNPGINFLTTTTGGSPVYNWFSNSDVGFGTAGSGNIPAYTSSNGGIIPLAATVSVNVTTNGCTGGVSSFMVTVNPLPTTSQPANQEVCNNGMTAAVHFTGTATSFSWTNNNTSIGLGGSGTGDIGAFTAINSGVTPVVATISVTPIYTNGGKVCAGVARSFTITVNPSPASAIAGTTSVCLNAISPVITFAGVNGLAPYTFTFHINGGLNQTVTTTSGSSVTVSIPTGTAGTFDYTITNVAGANGCSQAQSAMATITVEALPTATISGSTAVCQNTAAPLITFTGANGISPYTFTYQINGGANQNITTASGNSVTLGAPTNASGSFAYSLVSVSSSTGCSNVQSGTTAININPTPVLVINNPAPVCSPATVDLTSPSITAGSAAGLTFTYWTNAAATALFNIPATAGAGTYYIKGSDPATGCFSIKPVNVIVNPTPTLVITNPAPICAPATLDLTLPAVTSGSTAGLSYTYWIDAAATISYPTPAAAENDTYFIKGTTAAGCFAIKPVIASVFSTLSIPVFNLGTSSSICKGSAPITYNATVTNAFTLTYSLDGASLAAGNTINSATGLVTYTAGWTGTSQITATATGCGAPASAIHTVNINPTPLVTLVAAPATVCEGSGITLTATSSGGTVLQTYSGASGNINQVIADNSKAAYPYSAITLSGSGGATLTSSDIVIVTININHNSDQDLDIFLVDPTGTKAMLLSSDNGGTGNNYVNTILRTDAVNIIGSSPANNIAPFTSTYRPEGTITAAPDRSNAANNGAGDYTAVIPANALNGAPIDGDWSLRVFDDNNPASGTLINWSLSIAKQIGGGYTTVVNGPSAIGPVTYSGTNNSIATAVVTPPAGTQVYTVTTTDSKGCSATSNAVSLVIKPAPIPIVTADYCTYRPKVRLTTPACASCAYAWNTGAATNSIDVDIAGKYTVTVTYANGCTRTNSIQVADELVTNGDFSAGNTGFTTDYGYVADIAGNSELVPEGLYGVGTNGQNYHNNFWGKDHTTGTGNFMIVNGWGSTYTVWQETNVPVTPNTDYYFAAWAISLNNVGPYAKLRFEVNGVQVGTTGNLAAGTNSNANPWRPQDRFYGMWNSGIATTATIRIINLEPSLGGNDFGLDDISFGTLVNVPFAVSTISNSPVISPICSRNTLQLTSTVTGGKPPIVYTWTGPNGYLSHAANPSIPNIPPNAGGPYILSVVDWYNCPAEVDTAIVALNPTPEIPDQTALICSAFLFDATPVSGVPNAGTFVPAGTTYTWATPTISPVGSVTGAVAGAGLANISQLLTNTINSPATVTYTVTPVAGSCTGNTFKVIVTVNPAATANAGGDKQICAGSTVLLNGSIGGSAVSGNWTGGAGAFNPNRNSLNAVYTPSAAEITSGTVTLTLNSNDPDGAGPCSAATSAVIITINALPVLASTHANVLCHGAATGSIDLTVSAGTPAFTYTWTASNGGVVPSGQAGNQDLSALVAGKYTIVVNDTKTCGATASVTLTELSALVASESHTTVPCSLGATSVTITALGGTAPYSGTGTFAQFAGTTTYTVTDANSCTSSVAAIVVADPNSAPVITTCPVTRNITGCTTANISGPAFSALLTNSSYLEFGSMNNKGVASDNCSITTITYQDVATTSCPIVVSRTWTLGDASGLTSTCIQIINVNDIDAPLWTTTAGTLNRTIECSDGAGLAAAMALFPAAADACDPDVSNIVKTSFSFVASPGCSQKGSYTNTWQVTDECGNTSAAYTQIITITDNTAPIWLTAIGSLDRTLECSDIAGLITAQTLKPVAFDLCDGNVSNIVKNAGPFVPGGICANQGTYTNTWTVSDDCGNVSVAFYQHITINDNSSPVWVTAPGSLDRSVACSDASGLAAAQTMYPVAWDYCDGDVSDINKTSGVFVPSAGCILEGTYTNTWTVSDDCGNVSAIYTQVISIEDNTDPIIQCPPSDAFSCDAPSLDPSVTGFAVTSSDCAANPALTWADVIVPGGCAGNYKIIRTWTSTNICGNSNTCDQTIFVQDVTPPAIACAVSGNQNIYPNPAAAYIHPDNSWDATATDNCSGVTLMASLTGATVSGPHASLSGVSFNEGVTTVTWTATDGCGISADCEFTVTVVYKPEINCPADITSSNDLNVCTAALFPDFPTRIIGSIPINYSWVMTGATTGSGTGPIGNYTFNKGVTFITWTATNAAGADACTQTITVNDSQAPVFSVPANKIYCVKDIITADYFEPTTDITPVRPDYYLFAAGTTDLNLNPASFSDNCPASCIFEIRWRIDFQDGSSLPAFPATYITGQPSTYGADILLPGNTATAEVHHITYQVVDCSGNVSAPKSVNITINPRPNVIKLN